MDIFERNQRLEAVTLQREGMVARMARATNEINNIRAIILPGHPPIQFQYLLDALEAWYIAERTAVMDKFRAEDEVARKKFNQLNVIHPDTFTVEQVIKE